MAMMDSTNNAREDVSKSRPKITCSFSIERILRKEDKKVKSEQSDDERDSKLYENPAKTYNNDGYNRSCSPCRSYAICPLPVCPIPTTPMVYADPLLNYYTQKGIPSYCSLPTYHKEIIGRSYQPSPSRISYLNDSYRRSSERDFSSPLGSFYNQSLSDDEKNDSKRKGGQVRFSHVQSVELERIFNHQKYISPQERKQLSHYLHLSERQVKTWFQNRRAKWRRVKMETEMRRRLAQESAFRGRFEGAREKQTDLSLMNNSQDYETRKNLTKEACIR